MAIQIQIGILLTMFLCPALAGCTEPVPYVVPMCDESAPPTWELHSPRGFDYPEMKATANLAVERGWHNVTLSDDGWIRADCPAAKS